MAKHRQKKTVRKEVKGRMMRTYTSAMRPIAASIRRACLPVAGLFLTLNPVAALAGPEGGQVVGGEGNITTPDSSTTVINQQSHNLVIDWNSFNVSVDELVQFVQPTTQASALNRIYDQNPSEIFGTISANGNVLLVNPNGVFFKPGSSVNVNALVASGLDISGNDFMDGKLNFNGANGTDGIVVNQGVLEAATGGSITLVGKAVSNEGLILASAGQVSLIAGEQVTLDFDGDGLMQFAIDKEVLTNAQSLDAAVNNEGEIQADGGTVLLKGSAAKDVFSKVVNNEGIIKAGRIENKGGEIRLIGMGAGSSVLNTGTLSVAGTNGDGGTIKLQSTDTTIVAGNSVIDASSSDGKGGTVHVLGDKVGLLDSSRIDVSGAMGGGTVLVGGDFQGNNPDIQNASYTLVNSGTQITADSTSEGDGGEVIVWADNGTRYYGNISATGGDISGDGGFTEVSGKEALIFKGDVDLSAANGSFGTLLLDPATIVITGGTGDGDVGTDGDDTFEGDPSAVAGVIEFDDTAPTVVFESEIQDLDANIVLRAGVSITTTGNFGNSDVVLQNDRSLTLETRNNGTDGDGGIDLTGSGDGATLEFITSGTGNININASTDGTNAGNITVGILTTEDGGISLDTNNGTITVDGALTTGDVSVNGGTSGSITLNAPGAVNINAAITTGASDAGNGVATTGSINITGGGVTTDNNGTLTTGVATANGAGNDHAVSGGVTIDAGGGAVVLAAAITTGVADTDSGAAENATSGDISITNATSITGDSNAILTTGAALGRGTGGGIDAQIESGSITLSGTGIIELDASNALNTGDASLSNASNNDDTLTVGDIILTGLKVARDDATNTNLDVSFGTLTDLFNLTTSETAGELSVTTTGGAGNAGGIFITSAEDLITDVIETNAATAQNVVIEVTGTSSSLTIGTAIDIDTDDLTLLADNLDVASAITAGTATLAPSTTSRAIDLGTEVGTELSLTSAEIDLLTVSTLRIGSTDAGAITITDDITPANTTTLHLLTGSDIDASGFGVIETNLAITADGTVDFSDTATTVDFLSISNTGMVTFVDSNGFTVPAAGIDGVEGISGSSVALTTAGNLTIEDDGTLDTINATAGGIDITLTVDDAIFTTNTNAILDVSGGDLTITADQMVLDGFLSAAGQTVTLTTENTGDTGDNIDIGGADAADTLGLSQAEIERIIADELVIGDTANTGSIIVTATMDFTTPMVNPNVDELTLVTGGSGSDDVQFSADLTAVKLNIENTLGDVVIDDGVTVNTTTGNIEIGQVANIGGDVIIGTSATATLSTDDVSVTGDSGVNMAESGSILITATGDIKGFGEIKTGDADVDNTVGGGIDVETVGSIDLDGESITQDDNNTALMVTFGTVDSGTDADGDDVQSNGVLTLATTGTTDNGDIYITSAADIAVGDVTVVDGSTLSLVTTGSANITLDGTHNDFTTSGSTTNVIITSANDVTFTGTSFNFANDGNDSADVTAGNDLILDVDVNIPSAITTNAGSVVITNNGMIQNGIDLIADAGTISVEAGTYVENLVIDFTALDAGVNGFTLQGDTGTAADVIIEAGSGTNLDITGDAAMTTLTITDLQISGENGNDADTGIEITGSAGVGTVDLDNVEIVYHSTVGFTVDDISELKLTDVTLTGNTAGGSVGATGNLATLTFNNTVGTIVDTYDINNVTSGAGVILHDPGTPNDGIAYVDVTTVNINTGGGDDVMSITTLGDSGITFNFDGGAHTVEDVLTIDENGVSNTNTVTIDEAGVIQGSIVVTSNGSAVTDAMIETVTVNNAAGDVYDITVDGSAAAAGLSFDVGGFDNAGSLELVLEESSASILGNINGGTVPLDELINLDIIGSGFDDTLTATYDNAIFTTGFDFSWDALGGSNDDLIIVDSSGTLIDLQTINFVNDDTGLGGPGSGHDGSVALELVYTPESIKADDAVDKGDSTTVGIPITSHSFTVGDLVTITGTTNYDGEYTVESASTDEIVITVAYVAETFGGSEMANNSSDQSTIEYFGLTPIDTTGSTAADVVFNLGGGIQDVTLQDDGTGNDGNSRLDGTGPGVELTDFTNPTNSLTINGEAGNDIITLSFVDAIWDASIIINGGGGSDTVNIDWTTVPELQKDVNTTILVADGSGFGLTVEDHGLIVLAEEIYLKSDFSTDQGNITFRGDDDDTTPGVADVIIDADGTVTIDTEDTGGTTAGNVDLEYTNLSADLDLATLDNAMDAAGASAGDVTIPISAHTFMVGDEITITGTMNYDGVHTITAVGAGTIDITATLAGETFAGTETAGIDEKLAIDVDSSDTGGVGGVVTLGMVDDNAGANDFIKDIKINIFGEEGTTNDGALILTGDIFVDANGSSDDGFILIPFNGSEFSDVSTDIIVDLNSAYDLNSDGALTIDTDQDGIGTAGNIFLIGNVFAGSTATDHFLKLDTSGETGGDALIGLIDANDDGSSVLAGITADHLNDIEVVLNGTSGAHGFLGLFGDISIDADGTTNAPGAGTTLPTGTKQGFHISDGTTSPTFDFARDVGISTTITPELDAGSDNVITIDTDADTAGTAGVIDLGIADLFAGDSSDALKLDVSSNQGGVITLGNIDDDDDESSGGNELIRDIEVVLEGTNAASAGDLVLTNDIRLTPADNTEGLRITGTADSGGDVIINEDGTILDLVAEGGLVDFGTVGAELLADGTGESLAILVNSNEAAVLELIDTGGMAVDNMDGSVSIPIMTTTYTGGETITIVGTENYDGIQTIDSVTANEIVITVDYVAETFAGTETVAEGPGLDGGIVKLGLVGNDADDSSSVGASGSGAADELVDLIIDTGNVILTTGGEVTFTDTVDVTGDIDVVASGDVILETNAAMNADGLISIDTRRDLTIKTGANVLADADNSGGETLDFFWGSG